MLILTRRVGETIMIGDDIEITVLNIRPSHARIGINAPQDLPVYRNEVYERTQQTESEDSLDESS